MALVFKINCEGTLRRWVASEAVNQASFSLTLNEVETKVRELFGLSPTAVLTITYVDSDDDVITLGDDKDLKDACIVQRLNPLRLEVRVRGESLPRGTPPSAAQPATETPETSSRKRQQASPLAENMDVESFLQTIFPRVTLDNIKQFTSTFAPNVNLKLPLAALPEMMEEAFKQFSLHMQGHGTAGQQSTRCERGSGESAKDDNAYDNHSNKPAKDDNDDDNHSTNKPAKDKPAKDDNADDNHSTNKPAKDSNADDKHSNKPGPPPFYARDGSAKDVSINDGQAVHQGVQCDGCGMHPIEGSRYKSIKLHDYDLCSNCFRAHGKESDFQKVEDPVHPPLHGFNSRAWNINSPEFEPPIYPPFRGIPSRAWPRLGVMGRGFGRPPFTRGFGRPPFTRGPYGWRPEWASNATCPSADGPHGRQLDARFVKDVSIFDGTELAPGTKFTKIWQLRNTGMMPWPQNTQLVHIGGDRLSTDLAISLELPAAGLSCDQEIEASADLVAPEKAGRYVSYWRLVSLGQKFGHRVWVDIQVVPQDQESPQLQTCLLLKDDEEEKHATSAQQKWFADNAKTLVGKQEQAEPWDIQIDGFSLVEIPVITDAPVLTEKLVTPAITVASLNEQGGPTNASQVAYNQELRALEYMGFINEELNMLLLGKHNGSLQETVDDLLVSAGWDKPLNDLQEMGFNDQATNLQLLMKNNGSLKRVVKELLDLERSSNKTAGSA